MPVGGANNLGLYSLSERTSYRKILWSLDPQMFYGYLKVCTQFRWSRRYFLNGRQSLLWRHNGLDSVSNHQPHDCLLNRLFRRRSKKTSKLRVAGLCAGNSPGTGVFPVRKARTRKMFSFDDVIMIFREISRHFKC